MDGAAQAGDIDAAPAAHEIASMDARSNWRPAAAVAAAEFAAVVDCVAADDYAGKCDAPFQLRMQRRRRLLRLQRRLKATRSTTMTSNDYCYHPHHHR